MEGGDKDKDHIEEVEDSDEDEHVNNEKLQCRFYRKDFPEEGDLVVVCTQYYLINKTKWMHVWMKLYSIWWYYIIHSEAFTYQYLFLHYILNTNVC